MTAQRKDEAMKSKQSLWIVVAVLLAAGALMWAGCDRFSSEDREIAIEPASVQLTNNVNWSVTFHAGEALTGTNDVAVASTNLFYPLEWRVSDPSLGIILSSAGNSAIYRSYAGKLGVNVVHCQDQSGREGSAAVVLTKPPPTNVVRRAQE
jgi:hypothetical protein